MLIVHHVFQLLPFFVVMEWHILGYHTSESIHHEAVADDAISAGLAEIFYDGFCED